MNILEAEDLVKGMPDQQLQQQAKAPDGQVPQFLLISEIQRRTDMRKRYQAQQQEMPEGTVTDKIMQEGIASAAPQGGMSPQPPPAAPSPTGMAGGGIIRLAVGGQAPVRNDAALYNQVSAAVGNMFGDMPDMSQYAPQQMADGGAVNYDPVKWATEMSRAGRDREEILDILTQGGHIDAAREMMNTYDTDPETGAFAIPPEINLPTMSAATLDAPPLERDLYTAHNYPELGLNEQERDFVVSGIKGAFDAPHEPVKDMQLPEELRPQINGPSPDIGPGHGIASLGELGGKLLQDNPLYNAAEPGITALVDTASEFGDSVGRAHDAGFFGDMWNKASNAIYGGGLYDGVFGAVDKMLNGDPDNAEAIVQQQVAENPADPTRLPGGGDQVHPVNDQLAAAEGVTRQGTAASKNKTDAASMLMSMYDREKEQFPDMSDLISQQKNAAWSSAIMQLGAGIASNADDLGLGKAGAVMTRGMEKATDLDAKSRLAKYSAKQNEVDRDISILAKKAGIDVAAERTRIQALIQNEETRNQAIRFAGGLAEAMVPAHVTDYATRAYYVGRALDSLGVGHLFDVEELKREYMQQAQVTADNSYMPGG